MTTTTSHSTDIVIAGAGMVGLTLAIALGRAGVPVTVIDPLDPALAVAAEFDGRVSAVAFASWKLMTAIDAWAPMADQAQPILDIRVTEQDLPFFLHFDHRELSDDPFGYMVENRHIRTALYHVAAQIPMLRLLASQTIAGIAPDEHGVTVRLGGGGELRTRLLVGADGRGSSVRRAAGIRPLFHDYRQSGMVTTIEHEYPHQGVAHERFLATGPFAILPMAGGHRSSLVWCEPPDRAAAILKTDNDLFNALIRDRSGDFMGHLRAVGPRWSYPLSVQIAPRYYHGRLVLAGDAAHGIHPIAGQGLNLGLRDVAALAQVLVEAARLGQDPGGAAVLERYQQWRRFDNGLVTALMDGLTRLFSNASKPLSLARGAGLGLVNEIPAARRFFIRHARGTMGQLPKLLQGEMV